MRGITGSLVASLVCTVGLALPVSAEEALSYPALEALKDKNLEISIHGEARRLDQVLDMIEHLANLEVELGKELPRDLPITVDIKEVALKKVLTDLGNRYHLNYEVPEPRTLIVSLQRPDLAGKGDVAADRTVEWLLRKDINQSPDHFVAAVVEVASDAHCEGPAVTDLCTQRYRVRDLLASRSPDGKPVAEGDELTALSGRGAPGNRGGRMLMIAEPLPDRAGVFGATMIQIDPDRATVEQYRRILRMILTN